MTTAIRRSEPLKIEWEDQRYSSNDVVTVTVDAANATGSRRYSAVCRAPASVSSLTFPADLLSEIPADLIGRNARISVSLRRLRDMPPLFRTQMNDGREAVGLFSYVANDTIVVPIQ
jgi:hypothetical protein